MVYVTVKEDTSEKLHLTRQPSNNSWALLVGFCAFGLGAAYYGNDHIVWKVIYVTCGVFVGISCMDDWEDCEMNKSTGEIRLKKYSAWDMILSPLSATDNVIVAQLSDVIDVRVEDGNVKYFGTTHQVVLIFSTGISIGITDSFTFGSSSKHKEIADKIRSFLEIKNNETLATEADLPDSSSDTDADDTADDFEQIDKSELIEETEVSTQGDTASDKCQSMQ